MKAHTFRPIGIALVLILSMNVINAQEMDSTIQFVALAGDSTYTSPEVLPIRGVGIELHKINTHKRYLFLKGQVVRISCTRKNGTQKIKRARLIEVNGHNLTFKPRSNRYVETTYADSTIRYLEFTTRWTIIRGILVNTIVLVIYAIEILMVPIAILSGDAQLVSSIGNGTGISFDDFHKHVRLFKRGDRRWEVVVLTNSFSRT